MPRGDGRSRVKGLIGPTYRQKNYEGFPAIAKEEIDAALKDALENPDTSPNRLIMSARRSDAIAQMVLYGFPMQTIAEVIEKKFDMGNARRTVWKEIKELRDRWYEEDNANRSAWKSEAIRRIYSHIRETIKARDWRATYGFERLLAQLQGTLEPIRVDVEERYANDVVDYIGKLTPERIESMAKAQAEIRRKAQLYDGLVITTTGKDVS